MDVQTIRGDDNGDVQTLLDLSDELGCSSLTLRVEAWEHRDDSDEPADIYAADDWTSLDLNRMRQLRDHLDASITRVETHEAALMRDDADDDTDTDGM